MNDVEAVEKPTEPLSSTVGAGLIPTPFWFRWSFRCPRVGGEPSRGRRKAKAGAAPGDPASVQSQLPPLDDTHRLPDVPGIVAPQRLSTAWVGWRPQGLRLRVEGRTALVFNQDQPFRSSGFQVWIDTRDTRDIHRASRYCSRFLANLEPSGGRRGVDAWKVQLQRKPIARALAEPPNVPLDQVTSHAELLDDGRGWAIDLELPATVVYGFDPEVNRRLGFMLQVFHPLSHDDFWGVGKDFPIGEDPSLWATLELVD
ncbi:hypothetical protein Isop_2480 [Isosphaera pallida ATCC 43644]|uniref:Carbohydrate-binding domain-containing protein n=1 Tax=Isosphaera pallida (strain ATCC 43644 / DSM 9630 / IS1B) TaxID=575540 RepID=E8QXK4_ISOPI|nr:hypothetical protein [Isosphaera pallida]ADV63052.1 hypothetical protein Isop_2480 [Isosphaera pallida ATCC 43644]